MKKLLLVDDDTGMRLAIRRVIQAHVRIHNREPVDITEAGSVDDAFTIFRQNSFDVVLTNLNVQFRTAGLSLVRSIHDTDGKVVLAVMIADKLDSEVANALLDAGATHIFEKPVNVGDLDTLLLS